MSAATAVRIERGDVLMTHKALDPRSECSGVLRFDSVAGQMLSASCDHPGCIESLGIRRGDAEREIEKRESRWDRDAA